MFEAGSSSNGWSSRPCTSLQVPTVGRLESYLEALFATGLAEDAKQFLRVTANMSVEEQIPSLINHRHPRRLVVQVDSGV